MNNKMEKYLDNKPLVLNLSISKLRNLACPIITPPWQCKKLTPQDVKKCLEERKFLSTPLGDDKCANAEIHASRIAWLLINGWDDLIHVEFPIPGHSSGFNWPIEDGNHRYYASIMRKDKIISCRISGSIDVAEEFLP